MSRLVSSRIVLIVLTLPAFGGPSVRGIQNFYQVNQNVYRGAQPTDEGFHYLAQIGVKTVIDLREADQRSVEEARLVSAAGIKYVNVPMTGLTPPTEAEISKILGILEDSAAVPVFVHCKRGADRTGAVIAAYRIDHDRWDNSQALKEAMARGMSFFQFPRQSYIRSFQPRPMEAKTIPVKAPSASDAVTVDKKSSISAPAAVP
jgi:protein tyrosine phosphatase (PTP) superfamily phosphohydrolase (DUF442 family)